MQSKNEGPGGQLGTLVTNGEGKAGEEKRNPGQLWRHASQTPQCIKKQSAQAQAFQPLQRAGRISGHKLNNLGRQGPGVN